MQGQQLKFDIDSTVMQRHVKAVHEGDDGLISFAVKNANGYFEQCHYKLDDLLKMLETLDIDVDANYYFSLNSFIFPKRSLENIRQIRALHADLDCHDMPLEQIPKVVANVIKSFKNQYYLDNMPIPSLIVISGRGLQLNWLLEDLPRQAMPFWKAMQDEITKRLRLVMEQLNPDVKVDNVSDITRIFRLAGTINTNAEKVAELRINSINKYRLDDLRDEYFPCLKILDKPRKEKAAQSAEERRVSFMYNLYSLHWARFQDLIILLELRQNNIAGDECRRRMVFLYRYWCCCYMGDATSALESTLAFNATFTIPLPEKTVIRATESAEKAYYGWLSGAMVEYKGRSYRKGYNYRNSTLIDWLEIAPEEQRHLKTIISKDEKRRRKNIAQNTKRYGKDESGLTAKQRQRMERDKQILAMHEQGMTHREIAKIVGIAAKTVTNALRRV